MEFVSRAIDTIVKRQAEVSSLLMAVLVVFVCYEVVMRYIFNAPTVWGLELTTYLFGIHFVMGYSYTELHHGHVRVDILSARLPPKAQDVIHIFLTAVITLPLVGLLAVWAWDNAITSTLILERLSSAWAPPLWPIKLFMAVGFTLLFLQVLSNLIKRFLSFGQPEALR
jgi:TRAP-type mannitol/chloroaromatic compound transport system permease small subunit